LKFNYGSNKGAITSGSEYLGGNVSSFDETYSSDVIKNEVVAAGTGAKTDYSGDTLVLGYIPIRSATLVLNWTAGAVARTATANDAGVLSGTGLTTGNINVATGAITNLVFSVAPDAATNITATYRYNNEANTNVPEIDMDISKLSVEATSRKLRSKWSQSRDSYVVMHK